ncbi:helix-turn-helix domain-containing protein [Halorussus sp. AFM4]|uniref:helix-turn-helix domain-containing protein n=1 Tax=Halorussus sp. AFM4 TaxID=3421651 RepID=UPI003EBF4221
MALIEEDVEAYECPVCGSLGRHEEVPCCAESRDPVSDVVTYDRPDTESVLAAVFDLSSTDLAICRALMTEEEATAEDLAAELSLDRTTVNRRLNHLDDLGVVEKRPRGLEQGGQVNQYSPVPLDEVHRRLQLGLYRWLADAETVLDELHREKLELLVREAEVDPTDDPGSRAVRGEETAREDATQRAATGSADSPAAGGGGDSGAANTDGAGTDDADSRADSDGERSLVDRLLGRYRS